VPRNADNPGVDGMTVEEWSGDRREPWPPFREALLAGTYRPQPVTWVELPKPGRGVWPRIDRDLRGAGVTRRVTAR
jgi:retron-type reverse transcriptase